MNVRRQRQHLWSVTGHPLHLKNHWDDDTATHLRCMRPGVRSRPLTDLRVNFVDFPLATEKGPKLIIIPVTLIDRVSRLSPGKF